MARSRRSPAGVLYGGVQGFQVRKDVIITTQILAFLEKVKHYCWIRKK